MSPHWLVVYFKSKCRLSKFGEYKMLGYGILAVLTVLKGQSANTVSYGFILGIYR